MIVGAALLGSVLSRRPLRLSEGEFRTVRVVLRVCVIFTLLLIRRV